MSGETAEKKAPLVTRGVTFFRESVEELHKVSKPTRQETMQLTLVSLFLVVFLSVCLALLDLVFNQLMTSILS